MIGGCECFEIVLTRANRRRAEHGFFVERIRMVIDVAPVEGRTDLVAKNRVAVSLRHGIEARVKVRPDFFGIKDANRSR